MRERSKRTRDALIEATTELVAEVGYHRATTKAIAARAGVSEGTIYRHYPDKEALFAAAVLAGQREVTEWMAQLPGRAGTAPLVDLFEDTFTRLSQLREAVLPMNAAAPVARRDLAPGELETQLHVMGGPPFLLSEFIAAEQKTGRMSQDLDPARTAVMILASFFGVQTSPLAGASGLNARDIRAFAEYVTHGVT